MKNLLQIVGGVMCMIFCITFACKKYHEVVVPDNASYRKNILSIKMGASETASYNVETPVQLIATANEMAIIKNSDDVLYLCVGVPDSTEFRDSSGKLITSNDTIQILDKNKFIDEPTHFKATFKKVGVMEIPFFVFATRKGIKKSEIAKAYLNVRVLDPNFNFRISNAMDSRLYKNAPLELTYTIFGKSVSEPGSEFVLSFTSPFSDGNLQLIDATGKTYAQNDEMPVKAPTGTFKIVLDVETTKTIMINFLLKKKRRKRLEQQKMSSMRKRFLFG